MAEGAGKRILRGRDLAGTDAGVEGRARGKKET